MVSWFSKKQNSVALSTTKIEYIVAGSCCAQLLWIKQQLEDYGIIYKNISIRCDNTSVINLTKNSVLHLRTKHIKVRHHFIRDHVQNNDITLKFVPTENQIANTFTKPLNEERFCAIRKQLGLFDPYC